MIAFCKHSKCSEEDFPPNFCFNPGDSDSRSVFLEDCPNLSWFKYLPKPSKINLGVHPKVCCPGKKAGTKVETEEETVDGEISRGYNESFTYPKVSDQKCDGFKSKCVTLDRCPSLLDTGLAPQQSVVPCGFDKSTAKMMMCCPKKHVIRSLVSAAKAQPPRFPDSSGPHPRPVEDRTPLCDLWKQHGGCDLDRHFVFNGSNVGSSNKFGGDLVTSWEMFSFMQKTCMGSCGWDNDKVKNT